MSFRSIRCAIIALTMSIAVGFTVRECSNPELIETSGEKREWSLLQAVESENRHASLNTTVVLTIHGREVLGVKGASGKNIWILLRTESPPYYKQLPDGQYDLPIALVDQLRKDGRLSYTVDEVLRSHLRKSE